MQQTQRPDDAGYLKVEECGIDWVIRRRVASLAESYRQKPYRSSLLFTANTDEVEAQSEKKTRGCVMSNAATTCICRIKRAGGPSRRG